MKKYLLTSILLTTTLLAGCNVNNIEKETLKDPEITNILTSIVHNNSECGKDDSDSELFVDYALLWSSVKDNWNYEYYLVTNWQSFFVDERWNLNNSCWFWSLPTTIELSKDENWYILVRYEIAEDWSLYDSSTKEMFSEEAYKIWKDWKYVFNNKESFLKQAEKFFNVTVIPEEKNNYECSFCDKLWYLTWDENNDEKALQSNELIFNYTTEDNWNNTIYFGSNWDFEAKWSWDAWKWTRTFGKDENTVIVTNSAIDHVYDRYIITKQTEDFLWTILEIIQRD